MPAAKQILVTSSSRKVPLIKVLRKSVQQLGEPYEIIGGDSDARSISRFFTDGFWVMPRLDEIPGDTFVGMLKERGIRFIIPTRDGELAYFARHREVFREHDIHVMISGSETVQLCADKLSFSRVLRDKGFPAIATETDVRKVQGSLFVAKERYGAGSRSIGLRLTREEALSHAERLADPVFQPFLEGREVSVDAYLDKGSRVKGIIVRTRDVVVGGESQVTTSMRDHKLEALCRDVLPAIGIYGHCVLQAMIDPEGRYRIIECNARFGGASTLSYEMGVESFKWFLLESAGKKLDEFPFVRPEQEKRMVRFAEDLIL